MADGLTTERPRVVIAGGGVAGLETLLALRALAGDRVDITLIAPELRFVNRSMAVAQPFSPQRVRGIRLGDVAAAHRAVWHRGAAVPARRHQRLRRRRLHHLDAPSVVAAEQAQRPLPRALLSRQTPEAADVLRTTPMQRPSAAERPLERSAS